MSDSDPIEKLEIHQSLSGEEYDNYLDPVEVRRKAEQDPYAPGITHGGQHPDFIVFILNNLLFNMNYRKIDISIEKEFDQHHLQFTVNKRKK